MPEITHQEAHVLLQAATDQVIEPDENNALNEHLAQCRACTVYAKNLADLETNLRRTMHANWDNQQPKLEMQAILNPHPVKLLWNSFVSQTHMMEKVGVVIVLLLGYVFIANLVGIQSPITKDKTPTPLPTPTGQPVVFSNSPTPSVNSSLTKAVSSACETTIMYLVQENDTLDSIAYHHGTTKEVILGYNNLSSSTVFTGMELIIPLCDSTPSQIATIPKNTLSLTPLGGTILPTQPE